MDEPELVTIGDRGRVSLGKLHPAEGKYLGTVEPDGTVVLRPAAVMSRAQADLLRNTPLMDRIDAFAADTSTGVRSGRPKRRR